MNSLDKQRVDVGFAVNAFSSTYNFNGSSIGQCQAHTLTKDVYGREVGDFGIKRYDNSCGDKMDKTQNLNSILQRENNLRPTIFQSSLGELSGGNAKRSPYATSENITDMRIIPDNTQSDMFKHYVSFH